jgi:hypothetical protein
MRARPLLASFSTKDDPDVPPPAFQPWVVILAPACLGGVEVEERTHRHMNDWRRVGTLPLLREGDCLAVGKFDNFDLLRGCCSNVANPTRRWCSVPPVRWLNARGKCRRLYLPDGTQLDDVTRNPDVLFPIWLDPNQGGLEPL